MTAGRLARLDQAFRVAAGELGHCTAAWLFVREVAAEAGDEGVEALRDGLGRAYPVLDTVARRWLEGARAPHVRPEGVVAACVGAARVLVVGLEAAHLDALVPLLAPSTRIGLVLQGTLDADWERVLANWGGRVEGTDVAGFQRWAGARSVLVTFAYGVAGGVAHVQPAWVRVSGPDVRAQFRALIAWDVLRAPMFVYPRWLVSVPAEDFSHVAGH